MGVPLQELWIEKNRNKFLSIKIALAGGAIIDFMSGNIVRAPKWIQKIGMEWFFRFVQEPRRLFLRYFKGNVVFFWHVIRNLRITRSNRT
jgi:N-acetylglucosaminyldiphosphoundecaprenol N-acetyl-beta-D-mannosaminyltransferase